MVESIRLRFWTWLYVKARGKYRTYATNSWQQEVVNRRGQEFKVSVHAIMRYFERIEGYDIDELIANLTNGLAQKVAENGDGKYIVGNARVTVVKNTIVTVDESLREQPAFKRIVANPIKNLGIWLEAHKDDS